MTRDERIRAIFRKRRRFARKHAAKILGRSERWVEENRFEGERGRFLAWEEVVLLSYFLWTRVQIHRALGDMAARVFPRLAQLVELTVRIPHDKAIALRYEARRRGVDTSEIVAGGIDVFRDEAEEIETEWPDYLDAWHFPYTRRRARQIGDEVEALKATRKTA
jgi:hypothetical protein